MNHRGKGEALHKTLRKQTLKLRNGKKMMTRRELGEARPRNGANAARDEGSEIRDMQQVRAGSPLHLVQINTATLHT